MKDFRKKAQKAYKKKKKRSYMQTERVILEKLEKLEREVKKIKKQMIDVDTILTSEEKQLLDDSKLHEKEGLLASIQEIEDVRHKI